VAGVGARTGADHSRGNRGWLSRQLYPDDPITRVTDDKLRSFEGALVRAPLGRKGWGILFNTDIVSSGRINFTLAHEFGHYLLHRTSYPEGFNCSTEDMVRWDTEYGRVERQANVFASYLLMPLDDFRRQLSPSAVPDLDALGAWADRYDVSLTAAALKWLSYTERRAVDFDAFLDVPQAEELHERHDVRLVGSPSCFELHREEVFAVTVRCSVA